MERLELIISLLLFSSIAIGQRQSTNIDTGWKFHFGHAANAEFFLIIQSPLFFLNQEELPIQHVIGESYYPKWHGTLDDLRDNLADLVRRYNKDVIVVEYSHKKEEVNKIAFELPGGSCSYMMSSRINT